ncbi:hypothetical protein Nepgr_033898 [Nepenthes gracilis]|uniref:Uncharacterized protein n=1 Tax=Nepenthes gracilis TaxID=150966 RepID=A0AAD3Y903_NEPGR|nr:hypothetical protein Nepgr_033898 [Nepenthes gracilis]
MIFVVEKYRAALLRMGSQCCSLWHCWIKLFDCVEFRCLLLEAYSIQYDATALDLCVRSSWLVAAGYEQVPPWWLLGLIPLGPRVIRVIGFCIVEEAFGWFSNGWISLSFGVLRADAVLTFRGLLPPLRCSGCGWR